MGKTAAAISLLENVAVNHKHRLQMFPLEMGRMAICHRLYLGRARINTSYSRNGMLKREHHDLIQRAAQDIGAAPIWWDDSNIIDIDTLCARVKVNVRNNKVFRRHHRSLWLHQSQHQRRSRRQAPRSDRNHGQAPRPPS
jgi:replicative DNA helicase